MPRFNFVKIFLFCFVKIALKLSYICEKKQTFRALGAPPPDHQWPPTGGGYTPRPPPYPPHCEFLVTRLSSPNFGKNTHTSISGEDLFLVFIQFRRGNYVIFTKVLSHAKCIWSRLQKRPPMQNFTILVLTKKTVYI